MLYSGDAVSSTAFFANVQNMHVLREYLDIIFVQISTDLLRGACSPATMEVIAYVFGYKIMLRILLPSCFM